MTSPPGPIKRAGDPSDHDAERAGLSAALGMGAVRSPLPVDIDEMAHDHPVSHPDPAGANTSLEDLIAHQRPPVPTHLIEGALDEHARHVRHDDHED